MNNELTERLVKLVRKRPIGALGTLHAGAPFVSMVPYAIADDGSGFVIHVSKLAAHTKDMLTDARVSLLISEEIGGGKSPLALERVSVQGEAEPISYDARELPGFRIAYLARFPEAEQMFGFPDFSLFLIRPVSARFVAGFGEAHSLSEESMTRLLAGR
ncbi:MAG: pyridoxamine 5'-phosphate oxidase family protein [Pseudomonadota bacterium]